MSKMPLQGTYDVKIGQSFTDPSQKGFMTMRCDFLPASVDRDQPGQVKITNEKDVDVRLPNVSGADHSSTLFKGNLRQATKECVLIYNKTVWIVFFLKMLNGINVFYASLIYLYSRRVNWRSNEYLSRCKWRTFEMLLQPKNSRNPNLQFHSRLSLQVMLPKCPLSSLKFDPCPIPVQDLISSNRNHVLRSHWPRSPSLSPQIRSVQYSHLLLHHPHHHLWIFMTVGWIHLFANRVLSSLTVFRV